MDTVCRKGLNCPINSRSTPTSLTFVGTGIRTSRPSKLGVCLELDFFCWDIFTRGEFGVSVIELNVIAASEWLKLSRG